METEGESVIPGDGTGWGKRGKVWFNPKETTNESMEWKRLEARVTRLEANQIKAVKPLNQSDSVYDVDRLIAVVKDLPGNPPGVRLSDKRRAEIAYALKPFGIHDFQPPHRAPQEDAA